MTVEVLLFDLGGVLIEIDFDRVARSWASMAGVDESRVLNDFALDRHYDDYEAGRLSAAEYFAHLRGHLRLDLSDDQFAHGWNQVLVGEQPGMRELLQQLAQRYPIDLFSNNNPVHEPIWNRDYADLLRPIRKQYLSHLLGARKPEPESFTRVLAGIGVEPAKVLFFDDTLPNVIAARNAGLQATHIDLSKPASVAEQVTQAVAHCS